MRFHFFSSQINMLLTRQKEKTMMQSHSQKCDTQLPHLLQFWKEASMVFFFFFLNNIYIYIYIYIYTYMCVCVRTEYVNPIPKCRLMQ